MRKKPFTLLIHIALTIIVVGAIVTHYCGIQGSVTLNIDGTLTDRFEKSSGPGDGTFPFKIALKNADIEFYPGTTTPMDFKSTLSADEKDVSVSMNNVGQIQGWRFYQSGISPETSTLSVSYDPWGTGITYFGYALLGIAMTGYFFQRKTSWRALLKNKHGVSICLFLLCGIGIAQAEETELPCMQRPLASNLGKAYVYWNDRICPMQTMARDVTSKLYGSTSYKGMSAEQVLSGWLFYYDAWIRDYYTNHDEQPLNGVSSDNPKLTKQQKKDAECLALIRWLGTGEAFKIYPYKTAAGHIEWLSLTGRRPSKMSLEQWTFMQKTLSDMQLRLFDGKNIAANQLIDTLINGQRKYAGEENLPSRFKIQAERIYNVSARPLLAAIVSLLIASLYLYISIKRDAPVLKYKLLLALLLWLTLAYMFALLSSLWWISGHLPLSNGPETMMFMGLCGLLGAVICKNFMLRGAFSAVAAMSLFVAAMAGNTPRIGALMPVLASPLLSVHVMVVMTSYVLFMLMAILSAIGLCTRHEERKQELCRINRVMLTPAVFLLTAGIFIGAVWANQSWGRYWGWDPKETCALLTMLIYSVPLHWASPKFACFRKPNVLHRYLLLAILSVIFTYFGANYLLPGLHSYV